VLQVLRKKGRREKKGGKKVLCSHTLNPLNRDHLDERISQEEKKKKEGYFYPFYEGKRGGGDFHLS